ncbi:type I DNA topoisomerase [uncultured Parvimonas sp.]|uniref:type I DNA topoisomerase n=1 Tax=uncultured Parvimonas sp. TaxID=747372 RepID=UPI00280648CB|nr:type I DNA topoisomerase [uncultured Parvimonas sp.]
MYKNLVIVESPTKAKTVSKMLGSNYKVVASVGHIRDLPKSKLGIDIENNFQPEYINVRGKASKIKELKELYKNSKNIYLATDPDREGEAISWHIAYLLGLDINSNNRIEFHEITKNSIKESIKNSRKIDMNLVNSQQARRVLDRLVGYKLSPILWKKIKSGLSAGRVQSATLKIICERQEEIDNFIPEEFWKIEGIHDVQNIEFKSLYYGEYVNNKIVKKEIKNEQEALKVVEKTDKDNFVVEDVKKTKKERKPQPPFTTSTLQQEAGRKLGFSSSMTMSIAQQLYEGINVGKDGSVGLISYMRTDSTRISSEIVAEALEYITENYGKNYAGKGNEYNLKKKNSQDAHEGVRPSSIFRSPQKIKNYLTANQYKLYKLIWERTVASQMKAESYESTQIVLNSNNCIYKLSGRYTIFDGFSKIYTSSDVKDEILPKLENKDVIDAEKIEKSQHFTKPVANFTEASLVKKLEENGIGRPSTYASIINSLTSRFYIVIESKKIIPTDLGKNVNKFLVSNFERIINEKFTMEMEEKLDEIAENKKDWKKVISEFYAFFETFLKKSEEDLENYKIQDEVLDEKCPMCGKNLVVKKTKFGKFIGCSGFPDCNYIKKEVKDTNVKCPKCGGRIIEKISKKRKVFYGCENYPDCDFAIWDKPIADKKCEKCGKFLVEVKNRFKHALKCSDETCDFEIDLKKKG